MSRKKKERIRILKGVIWIICSIPFIVLFFVFMSEIPFLAWISSVIGIISLGGAYIYLTSTKRSLDLEEELEAAAKKRQEKADAIAGGKWEFPALKFYKECAQLGISYESLDTSYSRAKCKVIANELMSKASIPEQHMSLYNTEAKLKEYFRLGEDLAAKEKTRQEEKAARYKESSHAAGLSSKQKAKLSFLNDLKEKYGTAKRDAMLRLIVDSFSKKIREIEEAQYNMQQLGVILAQSASQTKPLDTAVAAGLGNGIGGAGAALYAAADAMNRNAQTEAENRRNREAVNRMAAEMCGSSFELCSDISALKKQREPFIKARDDLKTKVVIPGPTTQELFDSLTIEKPIINKLKSGVLSVKVKLKTSFAPEVPANVKTTVDGTLTGKVYAGDLFVGECLLPLPMYGVECGNPDAAEAETLCDRFAANDQPYRVEFSPCKLWVMEL